MSVKTLTNACHFLTRFARAFPIKIRQILTDNGKAFTDRLFARLYREPTGHHEFDKRCVELEIEHLLTKPRSPQNNGMVERCNSRSADVLKTNHFVSGEDRV